VPPQQAPTRPLVRLGWALGSMCAAVALAALALPAVQAWRTRVDAEVALGTLLRCMFGSGGSAASSQLRAREIAASLGPANGSTPGWPARCIPPLETLALDLAALERSRRGRCGPERCCPDDERCTALVQLRGLLQGLAPELRAGRVDAARLALVVPLAHRGHVEPDAPHAIPEPPAPVTLLARADIRPIDRGSGELLTDPPGSTELTLMLHEPERRYRLCTFDVARERQARCVDLGAELARGEAGELLGSEPGAQARLLVRAPATSAATEAHELVDVPSGRRLGVLSGRSAGGYVWRNGQAVVLMLDPARPRALLHRLGAAGPAPDVRVPLPKDLSAGPVLVFDEVVWVERASDGVQHLVARHVAERPERDEPLGPRTEIGPLGSLDAEVELEGCRTAEALVVLVRGAPKGFHTDAAVAFRTADGWHTTVQVAVGSDSLGLTCYGPTASLSFVDTLGEEPLAEGSAPGSPIVGRYAIDRTQCTSAGCTHQRSVVRLERFSRPSRYVLADLGRSVAVLWRSPLGDVRLRLGALETIDSAGDRTLFDDERHGGFAWELARGTVFARAGRAVLLAKTSPEAGDLTYALRLDASGELVPIDPG